MIYLDSAATTMEKPASVGRAMLDAMRSSASPGRGGHPASRRAGEIMFRFRETAAELFDVPNSEQVVLTFNATHGLNIAIRTLVAPGSAVLVSGYEHNAVTRVLHSIPGVEIRVASGQIFDQESCYRGFEEGMTTDIGAVICNHVSNVFGFVLPIERIAELCKTRGVPLIVDASQSAGVLPISVKKLGAAFVAIPGHKGLYGPQGTGILLCGMEPKPLLCGGTGSESLNQTMPAFLPDMLEAGTQNVCGAAGLTAGLRFVIDRDPDRIRRHECDLSGALRERIRKIPGVKIFEGRYQNGLFSFLYENVDCEVAGEELGKLGIAVRSGLHCAPLAHKSAGTLETGTIRISFSVFNQPKQLEYVVNSLQRIGKKQGTC